MATKLLTDQQLDLLTSDIMSKVRAKESLLAMKHSTFAKLNLAPLRKAAEAYLKERDKVMATAAELKPYMENSYNEPDGIDLSDFDRWKQKVDAAYSRQKSGYRSTSQENTLKQTIKAEILRNSLKAGDLDAVLAAIEKKYC